MMQRRRFVWFWLALATFLIALLALAMFGPSATAQTSSIRGTPPAPTGPATEPATAIETVVAAMRDAVRAQDARAYRAHVNLNEPAFRREHTYWIEDWASGPPLDRFALHIEDIRITSDHATGSLTMIWATQPDVSVRQAEFPALFVRDAAGDWRFAGGAWQTVETEDFQVRVFPGMEPVAEDVIDMLPGIYEHATDSLNHTPDKLMQIKLYDHPDDIGALTALRLPPFSGWNEPGESLKMLVPPGTRASAAVLAHELTHFLTFDMAGTTRGDYPWWLMEGVSEYVASDYWPAPYRAERLDTVRDWAASDRLAPWDAMIAFEETPVKLWRYVYPQGYAFVRFVSETYGRTARNDWLTAMAQEMDFAAATEATFEIPVHALDAAFQAWLAADS